MPIFPLTKPLPVFIQKGGKTLQIYSSEQVGLEEEEGFWDMLAEGVRTFKPYFTDDVFGTTILQSSEHCDLSLAGQMFPQLLSIAYIFILLPTCFDLLAASANTCKML